MTAASVDTNLPAEKKAGWPAGIPFIVGNEAAERFSFYGMKQILFTYTALLIVGFQKLGEHEAAREHAEAQATQIVSLFNAGCYAFPLIGAVVADRLFGKYPVILWVSLLYCVGHAILAVAGHTMPGVMLGLMFIAMGAGGIKPCVSANVGDQFTAANAHLLPKIFQIFYFSINFGSFFSTLLTPWLYQKYGSDIAFGVPGILMGVATVVFWLGRKRFIRVPPKPGGKLGALDAISSSVLFIPVAMFLFGDAMMLSPVARILLSVVSVAAWFAIFSYRQNIEADGGFFGVLIYAMRNQDKRRAGQGYFAVAEDKFGAEAAEGPVAVFRIAVVFSMVSIFWALYDQTSSSWINQAGRMFLPTMPAWLGGGQILPAQVGALNPIMIMIIIPILNAFVYPSLERIGIKLSPLRWMSIGMFMTAIAFITVALLQMRIEAAPPGSINVFWQAIPYFIITVAEVFVSAIGLEFAYTQAPKAMKSTIIGFFFLTISFGNKLVAVMAGLEGLPLLKFFWIFVVFMVIAACIFAVLAHFYKGKTYLQDDAGAH